jgi:hypothetical protein
VAGICVSETGWKAFLQRYLSKIRVELITLIRPRYEVRPVLQVLPLAGVQGVSFFRINLSRLYSIHVPRRRSRTPAERELLRLWEQEYRSRTGQLPIAERIRVRGFAVGRNLSVELLGVADEEEEEDEVIEEPEAMQDIEDGRIESELTPPNSANSKRTHEEAFGDGDGIPMPAPDQVTSLLELDSFDTAPPSRESPSARDKQVEVIERSREIWGMFRLMWGVSADEQDVLLDLLTKICGRYTTNAQIIAKIDHHIVGPFKTLPGNGPRPCLIAFLLGVSAGKGKDMTRKTCPYCSTSRRDS